ncbi:hypothetical protein FRC17_002655 [Serendipita sp. 399]|nr:hypothetical protein FRC17_002655 [Serendipita sp. 399]
MSSTQPEYVSSVPPSPRSPASIRTTHSGQQLDNTIDDATERAHSSPALSSDAQSLYAQSTMTDRTAVSRSSVPRFGSFAKLPLLSKRSRPTTSDSSASGSSATAHSDHSLSLPQSDHKRGGLLGGLFRKSKAEESATQEPSSSTDVFSKPKNQKERDWTNLDGEGSQSTPVRGTSDANISGIDSNKTNSTVRDPVKTVPSGKPPAVTFSDLAYRYGSPGGAHSGSRRL